MFYHVPMERYPRDQAAGVGRFPDGLSEAIHRGWHAGMPVLFAVAVFLLSSVPLLAAEQQVEKSIYLVEEDDRIVASTVQTGQFFDLKYQAKERVGEQLIANGVAIVITNQRFAGIGTFSGGWQSLRRIAGEKFISAEARDYSALVVTSDRIVSFNGRSGSWAKTQR